MHKVNAVYPQFCLPGKSASGMILAPPGDKMRVCWYLSTKLSQFIPNDCSCLSTRHILPWNDYLKEEAPD